MKKIYITILFAFTTFCLFAQTKNYVPTLLTPENNSIDQVTNVILDWNSVAGGVGMKYQLLFDSDSTFQNTTIINTNYSSYQTNNLFFNQVYYWKVRSIDPTIPDTSAWSERWSFNTIASIKMKSNPSNDQNADVNLVWVAQTGLTSIDLQMDTTSTFTSPLNYAVELDGSLSNFKVKTLYFGKRYYWQLRAKNENDTSVWSEVRNFKVAAKTTLSSPANNATDQMPDIQISWKKLGDTLMTYKYQISLNSNFTNIIQEGLDTTNSWKATGDTLMFGTKYYWRVLAMHTKDTALWSETRAFTIKSKVTLSSPANQDTTIVVNPSLAWKKINTSKGYQIQLSDTVNFYRTIIDLNLGDVSQYDLPNALDHSKLYYWRVRAFKSRADLTSPDTTLWSDSWSFKTENEVALLTPANQDTSISVNPTFTWNPVEGATSYKLLISDTIDFTRNVREITVSSTDQYILPEALEHLHMYYWKVKAFRSETDSTDWSDVWSFTTVRPVGIDKPIQASGITIYPSPTSGNVFVKIFANKSQNAKLVLMDLTGRMIFEQIANLNNGYNLNNVNLSDLENGIYILSIQTNKNIISKKIILNK